MSESARSSSDQKTSDLVRIRDNQRRSRARKKEYIHELEAKWRVCEQTGAEASAAIQAAARKVAEENKRLRKLLLEHGVAVEGEISKQAKDLDGLLGERKWCGGGREGRGVTRQQEQSEESPNSSYARRIRPAALRPVNNRTREEYNPTTTAAPFPPSPSDGIPTRNSPQVSFLHHEQQFPGSSTYYTGPAPPHTQTAAACPFNNQNYAYPSTDYIQNPPTQPPNSETSSCRTVADAIRYVRPNLQPDQLEAQMGCREGQDCDIPNMKAFELMDRLSDGRDQ